MLISVNLVLRGFSYCQMKFTTHLEHGLSNIEEKQIGFRVWPSIMFLIFCSDLVLIIIVMFLILFFFLILIRNTFFILMKQYFLIISLSVKKKKLLICEHVHFYSYKNAVHFQSNDTKNLFVFTLFTWHKTDEPTFFWFYFLQSYFKILDRCKKRG